MRKKYLSLSCKESAIFKGGYVTEEKKRNAKPKIIITLAETKKPLNKPSEQSKSDSPSFSIDDSLQEKSNLNLIPPRSPKENNRSSDFTTNKRLRGRNACKEGKSHKSIGAFFE